MNSFDPIKNHADFIRNNGIDTFGSMHKYVEHQQNLWNMLTKKAAENTSNIADKENNDENKNL